MTMSMLGLGEEVHPALPGNKYRPSRRRPGKNPDRRIVSGHRPRRSTAAELGLGLVWFGSSFEV